VHEQPKGEIELVAADYNRLKAPVGAAEGVWARPSSRKISRRAPASSSGLIAADSVGPQSPGGSAYCQGGVAEVAPPDADKDNGRTPRPGGSQSQRRQGRSRRALRRGRPPSIVDPADALEIVEACPFLIQWRTGSTPGGGHQPEAYRGVPPATVQAARGPRTVYRAPLRCRPGGSMSLRIPAAAGRASVPAAAHAPARISPPGGLHYGLPPAAGRGSHQGAGRSSKLLRTPSGG